jgi:hypothetical protein
MQDRGELLQRGIEGEAARGDASRFRDRAGGIAVDDFFQQRPDEIAAERAQHVGDLRTRDLAAAVRDRLVEEAETVADAPGRRAADECERGLLERDLLGLEHALEVRRDRRRRKGRQVELQAAREDRDRELLGIRGRENELDVLRRLFECLQHRVERMPREHVHLVDDVDLEAARSRHVLRGVEELAHLVHLGVRRRVHLEQVDEASRIDLHARAALSARLRSDARLAVDGLGEDARERGLADAARSREQVRVVQALRIERVRERRDHVLLADELLENAGAPLARQDLIGHQIGGGGEPEPRHLKDSTMAASFPT